MAGCVGLITHKLRNPILPKSLRNTLALTFSPGEEPLLHYAAAAAAPFAKNEEGRAGERERNGEREREKIRERAQKAVGTGGRGRKEDEMPDG